MYPSSALCRTQEALQRDRAVNAALPNVRTIAERAAAAWGAEGHLAEKREERQEKMRRVSLSVAAATPLERDDVLSIRENPDRGLSAPDS